MAERLTGTLSEAEQWEAFAELLRLQSEETDSRAVYYALQRSAKAADEIAARIRPDKQERGRREIT